MVMVGKVPISFPVPVVLCGAARMLKPPLHNIELLFSDPGMRSLVSFPFSCDLPRSGLRTDFNLPLLRKHERWHRPEQKEGCSYHEATERGATKLIRGSHYSPSEVVAGSVMRPEGVRLPKRLI